MKGKMLTALTKMANIKKINFPMFEPSLFSSILISYRTVADLTKLLQLTERSEDK
jgi:hypothetical protein